jgi:rhodanese-related sulfurtransferase
MRTLNNMMKSMAVIGLLTASAAFAAETPTTPPAGVTIVDAAKAKEMHDKGAIMVDARIPSEFGEGTIKGAISVPYNPEKSAKTADFDASQDTFDFSKLKDKNANYVVFCNSGTCFKSYKAATVLAKNGYKHIYWYRDGFPDWKAKGLPTE